MFETNKTIPDISIGIRDTNVKTIRFNFTSWAEEYGQGSIHLWHRPYNDEEAHEVQLTISDGLALWAISRADTTTAGPGSGQLVYAADSGAIVKSNLFSVIVQEDLGIELA